MSMFDSILESANSLGAQMAAAATYGKGQYVITRITSDVATEADWVLNQTSGEFEGLQPGLYKRPLSFGVTNLDSHSTDDWESFLDAGQMGILIDQIKDSNQLYMDWDENDSYDAASLISLYFGFDKGHDWISAEVQDDVTRETSSSGRETYFTDPNGVLSISYGTSEAAQLRALFGQPEGSDTGSIIESAISSMSSDVAARQEGLTRFKKNATKTKPFTGNELTLLTGEEEAQGVALSLETVTGSAGVTSTTEYTTGGMY